MKLVNPTDSELNAAFAKHVCNFRGTLHPDHWADDNSTLFWINLKNGIVMIGEAWRSESFEVNKWSHTWKYANFTTCADAVLPWLEKFCPRITRLGITKIWCVELLDPELSDCTDASLPKTMVIVLLRAHGVEIEFT